MTRLVLIAGIAVVSLAGCEHSAGNAEAVARRAAYQGKIMVGETADDVIRAAGRPTEVVAAADRPGEETWIYRAGPRNPNDYIRAGHRRRVEFDPVKRSNVIIVEPVDDRVFPHLRSYDVRVSLRDNRVAAVEQVEAL